MNMTAPLPPNPDHSRGPRRLLPFGIAAAIVLAAALVLWGFGRPLICTCGTVKLWHGTVLSSENSQHLADWYSFSHITHGFLFYALIWLAMLVRGREQTPLSFGWRLVVATLIEAVWEVVENSDAVIERYRAVTISLDYYGDSVINSVADMGAMMLGFWLAYRLPVRLSLALAVISEVMLAIVIRDGLALNIVMLVWPVDAIRDWQGAL
ncbi:DUF2585 domain-containing protein [Paracoccus cavernae]|uniref:DUF2585 domain-containing protein n=1 Tax=Paracoccus cavernae TaxID=1571207 RepID=UPI0035F48A5A